MMAVAASVSFCPVLQGGMLKRPTAITSYKTVAGKNYFRLSKRDDVLSLFLFGKAASAHAGKNMSLLNTLRDLRNSACPEDDNRACPQVDDGLIQLDLDDGEPPPKRYRLALAPSMCDVPVQIKHIDWAMSVLSGRGYKDVWLELTAANMDGLSAAVQEEGKALAESEEGKALAESEEGKALAESVEASTRSHDPVPLGDGEGDLLTPEKVKKSFGGMTWVECQRRWVVRFRASGKAHQRTFTASKHGDAEATKRDAEATAQEWIDLHLK